MNKKLTMLLASLFLMLGTVWAQVPVDSPEEAITGLLNRICGDGAAEKFEIVIDASLAENGKDVFVITSQNSKPCIKGNTQLSVATGINWYLNHYAHINLTWNNLTTDLSKASLPVPTSEEKHVCNTTYRYDFNTCTFSYSMAFWTWERWQQEIDWMALHGINAPLNLVGLDVVTRKFLRELGVSENDINAYIAGPGFIAWFAMNNLEGWGGTINSPSTGVNMSGNPDWWYTRQEQLCRNMLQRMRELGMQPVIPGFSGQVPNCIVNYTIDGFNSGDVVNNGTWAGGYTRPDILKPNTTSYQTFATVYYKHLHEVMGVSELYSIDPFHEGSLPSGVSNETCYPNIMAELDKYFGNVEQSVKNTYKVTKSPSWIIQYWQGVPQSGAFTAMKNAGYTSRFIGLDLFADNIYADNAAKWRTNYYDTCPYIYCMLHNFGGRSGLHGRLETTMDGYFQALAKGNNCQGIGATPEGTETNPVLYDMLFELPWMDVNNRPTADEWLAQYAHARYGVQNEKTLEALQDLKKSVWDCKVNQQGTSEAVILARPNWTIGSVSSWSTSAIYWDTQDVLQAADKLYSIKDAVTRNGGQDGIANYNYDFIDVVRQAMVDYAAQLLPLINAAHNSGDNAEYTRLYQLYLQLMLDLDEMLSYDENFKLERWTSLARNIADEVAGTTENDRNWLEWNARTQVTVWSSGNTDLHDYSNRCWAGLIKDFHYKRWKQFFENNGNAFSGGWYSGFEYPWTVDFNETYNLAGDYSQVVIPTDMTATEKVAQTFGEYFGRIKGATKNYIFPMGVATKATKSDVIPEVYRGQEVELPLVIGKNVTISSVWVDLNNDGAKGNGETLTATNNQVAIPADAKIGKTTAQVVYSDGTDITVNLALVEDITATRTVTAVAGANGSVVIEGTNELSISTTEAVKMIATANTGYNFEKWTDAQGNTVSNDNPYIYYGKEDATFTANFIQDKWGVVACNGSFSGDIAGYAQFIHNLTLAYYNREPETILEETTAPTQIFNTVPTIINVPQGASFDIEYDNGGSDGLKYCYFRAFIDLNQDGDFDDEGELLKEVGTNGAQNAAVCSNKINVLLPYDMPLGITHMRLRFDGAWDNGNKPSERGAKDASIRPVYEIIINVTEKSNKAATINVETNSADWGTVEVWTDETPDGSTGTTWNVSANIPMYLRATKASEDVEFLGWYDHYGRLLTENLEHTMYAREDATYTARFRRILEIDDWQFEYRTTLGTPDMVVLTSVRKSGTHDLVIPETIEILGKQYKIVGFDNNVFNDNKELWTISLPKSIEFLSEKSLLSGTMTGKVASGTGTTDQANYTIYNLEETVVVADGFKVTVKGTSDGSTFNQWGSGLFATGTNPLDAKFDDGFQFYLAKAGNFVLKVDDGDKEYALDNSNCKVIAGTPFTATIVYKNNTITITVDNGAGQTGVYTRGNVTLADISTFSAAIPTGITLNVNVETNKESNPFSGCSNLGEITFNGDCTNYYVNNEGDLYNTGDVLVCSPEGKEKANELRALGVLIDNTEALIEEVTASVNPIGKATEIALSATEGDNYIWCNAPQAGSSVESLLDNNPSTFFHSNWQSTTAPADGLDHHLTIENLKGIIDLKFRYQGRSGSNLGDYPTTIKVQGSNNGTDYDDIAVVQPRNANGGTIGSGAEWTSERLGNGNKYTYLRFMVTATTSNRNADGHIYWHMAEFDLFKLTSTVEVKSAYKNIAEITNEEAEEAYDLMVSAQYLCNNAGTDEELKTVYEALKSSYDAIKAKIGDNEIEEELPYEIEQTYSGSASWSATSVFPEGLKSGAASGSHGNPATHIGANGDTMYKKVTPVVTNGDDLIVTFTYASGNSHGLIILGVDVVDGNGDVVKADYHVGFTGGEQDNKVYTLTDLDAGNYILRYYVCNKANDHDLNHTGGTISVSGAREIAETEVNAVEAMWTTLKAKAQSDYIAYEGEGLGRYNNTDDIKEKKAATPEATVAGYTAAFVALDDAMDGTPFAKPEAGKFYTIKNNGGTGYLNGDGTSGRVQFNGIENEANSVFYFIDNKLLSYKTGYYLAAKIPSGKNGNFLCYTETVNESTNITFKKSLAKGKLLIEFDGNRSLSSAGIGDSEAADSGQTDANYRFTVEEVTSLPVAVRSAGYATFIAPVALKIPANVKAHTGEVTGNYLVLTEVTGTIPANTGVVLEAAENTYSFNIVADVDSIHSDLVGSTAAKANDKKNEEEIPYYTLQKPGNEVVFMQYNGDVLAGSKAYLDFTANPTSAKSISIRFEGTTDIESSTLNPQPSTQIYDLMGRRVEAITKGGIYIVNGRKVVVK